MNQDIFVIVIASHNIPLYYDLIEFKKKQLAQYNISNIFLFDECPVDYKPDSNDIFFSKMPPPYPAEGAFSNWNVLNPHMILKFINYIKTHDLSKYKFVLRVNLSTFINYNLIYQQLLATAPTTNSIYGNFLYQTLPDWNIYSRTPLCLLRGTLIIFSQDAITKYSNIDINNPDLYKHNDDTVISHFVNKLGLNNYNINMYDISDRYDISDLDLMHNSIIRIKYSNRVYDIYMWKRLLKLIDNINI